VGGDGATAGVAITAVAATGDRERGPRAGNKEPGGGGNPGVVGEQLPALCALAGLGVGTLAATRGGLTGAGGERRPWAVTADVSSGEANGAGGDAAVGGARMAGARTAARGLYGFRGKGGVAIPPGVPGVAIAPASGGGPTMMGWPMPGIGEVSLEPEPKRGRSDPVAADGTAVARTRDTWSIRMLCTAHSLSTLDARMAVLAGLRSKLTKRSTLCPLTSALAPAQLAEAVVNCTLLATGLQA